MAPNRSVLQEVEVAQSLHLLSSASLPVTIDMETMDDPLDLSELRLDLCGTGVASCPTPEDDELTSLTWLQDHNLLKSIRAGAGGEDALSDGSPLSSDYLEESSDGGINNLTDGILLIQPPNVRYNPKLHVNAKPPYSFSCLIFMAIEDAPAKALPVKDIYSWILNRFPYFQNAPTGWKNSVRHNLSLNKCFRKVDKDKGQNIGKGSLWCIDPDYRPNLLQALRKTPYHPYHQLQMLASQPAVSSPLLQRPISLAPRANLNIPSPELFPYLSKRLAASNIKDPEVDAAATMLSLKNGPHTLSCVEDKFSKNGNGAIRIASERRKKRLRNRLCTAVADYHHKLKQFVPIITCSPSEDHTYSTCFPQSGGNESPNNSSSIDEPFDFSDASNSDGGTDSITHVDGTESNMSSFNDDEFESCDEEGEEDWEELVHKEQSLYRTNNQDDDEEEQKKIVEGAADALLNLAGIKTHLDSLRRSSLRSTHCGRKKELLFELAQR